MLGIIDGGSIDPVYIVWNKRDWCPMACKVFSSSVRAKREADVLSSLSHPNIVRLLDLEAPVHLLMPFLEGPTLANMIRNAPRNRLGIDDALRIAIHIGAALIHVHERGYLHMDVKPSNVIIARGGTPILFDFRHRKTPRGGTARRNHRHGRLPGAGGSAAGDGRNARRCLQFRGDAVRHAERTPAVPEALETEALPPDRQLAAAI